MDDHNAASDSYLNDGADELFQNHPDDIPLVDCVLSAVGSSPFVARPPANLVTSRRSVRRTAIANRAARNKAETIDGSPKLLNCPSVPVESEFVDDASPADLGVFNIADESMLNDDSLSSVVGVAKQDEKSGDTSEAVTEDSLRVSNEAISDSDNVEIEPGRYSRRDLASDHCDRQPVRETFAISPQVGSAGIESAPSEDAASSTTACGEVDVVMNTDAGTLTQLPDSAEAVDTPRRTLVPGQESTVHQNTGLAVSRGASATGVATSASEFDVVAGGTCATGSVALRDNGQKRPAPPDSPQLFSFQRLNTRPEKRVRINGVELTMEDIEMRSRKARARRGKRKPGPLRGPAATGTTSTSELTGAFATGLRLESTAPLAGDSNQDTGSRRQSRRSTVTIPNPFEFATSSRQQLRRSRSTDVEAGLATGDAAAASKRDATSRRRSASVPRRQFVEQGNAAIEPRRRLSGSQPAAFDAHPPALSSGIVHDARAESAASSALSGSSAGFGDFNARQQDWDRRRQDRRRAERVQQNLEHASRKTSAREHALAAAKAAAGASTESIASQALSTASGTSSGKAMPSKRLPTVQLPFLFRSDARADRCKNELKKKTETDASDETNASRRPRRMVFKAPPPLPPKVVAASTIPKPFLLATDARVPLRADFDQKANNARAARKERQERQRQAELMAMRRDMKPKARDLPPPSQPTRLVLGLSKPTRPKEPHFRIEERLRSRASRQKVGGAVSGCSHHLPATLNAATPAAPNVDAAPVNNAMAEHGDAQLNSYS